MEIIDEILDIPFKPWEYMTYKRRYDSVTSHGGMRNFQSYVAIFETLKNYDRSQWKLGDIVKFGSGYNAWANDRWEAWFLNEKDRDEFMKKHKYYNRTIPAYARNQYAIVLARYKWTKHKYAIFRDYGTFIMMLTGSKVGHIRKYYIVCPFNRTFQYPYTLKYEKPALKMLNGVKREDDIKVFLENLVRKLNGN